MSLIFKNILKFSLPLALFFMPAFCVLWYAGEFYSLKHIGTLARGPYPILVGDAYSNFQTQYQLSETKARVPQVLSLGNSHVGEFRSAFLKDPAVFYNAAHAILALSDFSNFIDSLDTQPDILIVDMSQSYFNPENTRENLVERPNPFSVSVAWYDPMFESFFRNGGWWKVYVDFFHGKFTFARVFREHSGSTTIIGLRSVAEHYGFTNDGSDYYGNVIQSTSTQANILQSVHDLAASVSETDGYIQGSGVAPYGSGISPEALRVLREFLQNCKGKNIFVIGFMPSIAQAGYDRMKQYPDARYAYAFENLAPILRKIYAEYGFDFYDFTNPTSFGSSDYELVNAEDHVSEKAYLRMFIQMTKGTTELQPYVDLPYLEKSLAQATNSFVVFGSLEL